MSSEIVANINTEAFEPVKKAPKRRANSTGDGTMEVDIHKRRIPKRPRTKSFSETKDNIRKIPVPSHRYSPLKEHWLKIFTPIVEHLQLQVRFNLATRHVEIRASEEMKDLANLQKAADFVKVGPFLVHKSFCYHVFVAGICIRL